MFIQSRHSLFALLSVSEKLRQLITDSNMLRTKMFSFYYAHNDSFSNSTSFVYNIPHPEIGHDFYL